MNTSFNWEPWLKEMSFNKINFQSRMITHTKTKQTEQIKTTTLLFWPRTTLLGSEYTSIS